MSIRRDVNWLPQPGGGMPAGGAKHPGFEHGRRVAVAARRQPGVWLDLNAALPQGSAHDKVYRLRHRPSIAFRGAFEFRAEKRGGSYAVQVRYVGESSS